MVAPSQYMIAVVAADPGVLAAILSHGSPPAGAQLHGDERAIERFLQRALDPPGELVHPEPDGGPARGRARQRRRPADDHLLSDRAASRLTYVNTTRVCFAARRARATAQATPAAPSDQAAGRRASITISISSRTLSAPISPR
jgi:hypothetical protein